jgi:hypothetical protein
MITKFIDILLGILLLMLIIIIMLIVTIVAYQTGTGG